MFTDFTGNEYDSLVTLYLEIQVVEIGLDQVGSTLSVTADSGTFQWVECPDYDIIPGATDSTFTPTQNGHFAVIVTKNGCTDTSACYPINNIGVEVISKWWSICRQKASEQTRDSFFSSVMEYFGFNLS